MGERDGAGPSVPASPALRQAPCPSAVFLGPRPMLLVLVASSGRQRGRAKGQVSPERRIQPQDFEQGKSHA